jgi:hypothetical protein
VTLSLPVGKMGTGALPALIVNHEERRRLAHSRPAGDRFRFYDRADLLCQSLDGDSASAVIIETRDVDGFPVPAAIRTWIERNPLVSVIVWTRGGDAALREVLSLAAAGADVRLVLRQREDLAVAMERLFARPGLPHPGAVPALLNRVVLSAPGAIQPDLTLATYLAWPYPSVHAWAETLHRTRQALNARLSAAHFATASVVLDAFSAAEIAIRCTLGTKLRHIAAAMGRPDERSLRRRLARLGCRPEALRDEADFRSLIPRIVEAVQRPYPELG